MKHQLNAFLMAGCISCSSLASAVPTTLECIEKRSGAAMEGEMQWDVSSGKKVYLQFGEPQDGIFISAVRKKERLGRNNICGSNHRYLERFMLFTSKNGYNGGVRCEISSNEIYASIEFKNGRKAYFSIDRVNGEMVQEIDKDHFNNWYAMEYRCNRLIKPKRPVPKF